MKRKALWLLLVIGAALSLGTAATAVSRTRNAKENEIHHKEKIALSYEYQMGEEEALLKDGLLPKRKEVRTWIYPEEELLTDIKPNLNKLSMLNDRYWRTSAILGHYPTPNIRYMETVKNGHYYAVYMTEKGARYYVFFDHEGEPYGYPVYMVKALSYAEFSGLHIGDPIEKVEEIDPAAETYRTYFPKRENGETVEQAMTRIDDRQAFTGSYELTGVHLLTDGVLEIRYTYTDEDEFAIRELDYHADFIGRNNVTELIGEDADKHIKDMDYSYSILEKDYIGDEIVLADAEAETTRPLTADEIDWEIALHTEKASTMIKKELFSEEELTTITITRYAYGEKECGMETVFATGVTPETLAHKADAGEWTAMTVKMLDGSEIILNKEELTEKYAVLAWIQNKEYAMLYSDTGVSLVFKNASPEEVYFSVKEIRFVSE